MNEEAIRLRGEVAFKEGIPLHVRVSEGDSSLTQKTLTRFRALRDSLQARNAPDDNAPLSEWMIWATIKE